MINEVKFKFKLTREQRKYINDLPDEETKKIAVKNLQRHFEYENSREGVSYNLDVISVPTSLESTIIMAVQKLPPKVKEFVYQRCDFTSVSQDGGQCHYKRSKKSWLIILGENADESVVAHEIAHARLGHRVVEPIGNPIEDSMKTETEACNLAKHWGFVGSGTEVDKCIVEEYERKRSGSSCAKIKRY